MTNYKITDGVAIIEDGTDTIKCATLIKEKCTKVIIPNSVVSIEQGAFIDCKKLTEITIPASVTHIGANAFVGCPSLTKITVAEGNPVYDSRNNCNAIIETATNRLIMISTSGTIPDTVTSIGPHAFDLRKDIFELNLPESVTEICSRAFVSCENLTSIHIPARITKIGTNPFGGCPITKITVDKNNPYYDSREGCNAIIETSTNKLITGCASTVIPDSVSIIGKEAFAGCTTLTQIHISASVQKIEEGVFRSCKNLDSIIVDPANPVYDSRENCNAIIETKTNKLVAGAHSTIIPESVTELGDFAISGDLNIKDINIPASIKGIYDKSLYLRGLQTITFNSKIEIEDLLSIICIHRDLKAIYIPTGTSEYYKEKLKRNTKFCKLLVEGTEKNKGGLFGFVKKLF